MGQALSLPVSCNTSIAKVSNPITIVPHGMFITPFRLSQEFYGTGFYTHHSFLTFCPLFPGVFSHWDFMETFYAPGISMRIFLKWTRLAFLSASKGL